MGRVRLSIAADPDCDFLRVDHDLRLVCRDDASVIHGRGATDVFATGRYVDRYVSSATGVKLSERVAICDSSRIDTLLALPL